MPKSLKLCVASVVVISAVALIAATLAFPAGPDIAIRYATSSPGAPADSEIFLGVLFWAVLTVVGSAFPVQLPRGTNQAVAIAPIMGAMFLGGPAVAAWIAAIGTTELRELRGRVPWYGSLANHGVLVIPAVAAGVVYQNLLQVAPGALTAFVGAMLAAALFMILNLVLVSLLLGLRT